MLSEQDRYNCNSYDPKLLQVLNIFLYKRKEICIKSKRIISEVGLGKLNKRSTMAATTQPQTAEVGHRTANTGDREYARNA